MKAIDNSEINVKMEQESSFSHHQSSRHFINDIDFKTSHINNALEQKNSGLIGSSSGALGIVAGVGAVLGIGSVIAGLLLYNKKKNTKVSYKEVRQDDPQSDLPLSIIASKSCNSVYKDTVVKV
ncbi:hypothetical protein [Wolbachia endosymbiont of Chironomus riparius]|uniref:hypothetical protein n=1 Tax=Wolbachia endosymbiont of Chironomus riparius TaxID=2883238 RepID=UPI00209E519C|nr:hypothetical protein [Wolbachia endosymbiont of Chironomus riparius]